MYVLASFQESDPTRLAGFVREHNFATIITTVGGELFASHAPLLSSFEPGGDRVLFGHLARANPQLAVLQQGTDVLAIFHGPDSYVSPSWYVTTPQVPTWNYAVVHAWGRSAAMSEGELSGFLDQLVAQHESELESPWPGLLPEDFRRRLLRAIGGFTIRLSRVAGKFKLGQNRSREDQLGMLQGLETSGGARGQALAAFIRGLQGTTTNSITTRNGRS